VPSILTALALPAFLTSLAVALTIFLTKGLHGRFTFDGDQGVQKVHKAPTPRIGGIAVAIGLLVGLLWLPDHMEARGMGLFLLFSSLPALAIGLWEDISKSVSPRVRLASHIVSALVLVLGGGYILRDSGFELTDVIMTITPIAVCISVFAVAGMTNAVNIIDGYNGLASGTVIIMTAGLALLAIRLGDMQVFIFSTIMFFAVLGFFLVNFPFGKVFLGDAGAYFCGFLTCALVLVLSSRNPGLSPWVPLLVIIYPAWEVLISILRRLKRSGHSPSQPDKVHLHNLVSRSFARPLARRIGKPSAQNALTGAAIWPLPLLTILIAINVEMSSVNALLGIIVFQAFYDRIYRKLSLKRAKRSDAK
jgi:UDP-N-acetylmuramyl pentapeptide phosphotransferase/UDP-N-acetylglucosamine-1-phosphate transferase